MGTELRHRRRSDRRRPSRTAEHAFKPRPGSPLDRIDSLLLHAVDGGLAASVMVVPFALGGRIALGQLAMVGLAVWVALCWTIRQSLFDQASWIRSSTEPLLLAAVGLIGLQLVALPQSWLAWLSPQIYKTLPLWSPAGDSSATLGTWSTISLTPTATRNALVMVLAFMLLFLTTVQRVRRVEDVERLLRWIAITTLSMAIFAILQYLTCNGKYFWFYEHQRVVKECYVQGSFLNRNHFAQFMTLGMGPLVWWVWQVIRNRSQRASQRNSRKRSSDHPWEQTTDNDLSVGLRVLGLTAAAFAILMSLSRGGVLSAGLAGAACLFILYRAALIDRRTAGGLTIVGLLVIAGLSIYGYDALTARMDDFQSIEELDSGGRMRLWKANLAGIADYPITGTGLGSHREVCPTYLKAENHHEIEYTHAENGYLQVALETGIPGLVLALFGVGFCIYWAVQLLRTAKSTRILLCIAAIVPGFVANFAHSAFDFVWYVPGCMVTLVVLAACACRLWQLTWQNESTQATKIAMPEVRFARPIWVAMSFCLGLTGFFMLENRATAVRAEAAWNRYMALEGATPDEFGAPIPPVMLRSMAQELATVVSLQPGNARAHTRLADIQIKLFNQPEDPNAILFDVRQVRDTVIKNDYYESPEALRDWLSRAFGPRVAHLDSALHHAIEAARSCPLQGEVYLSLADVGFLMGPNFPQKPVLVQQALDVRPFDGTVLFVAGQEAAIAGDMQKAIECWQASFDIGPHDQNRLLTLLTREWSAETVLETFRPSVNALRLVSKHFEDAGREDEAMVALSRYADAAARQASREYGRDATKRWIGAARAYARLGESTRARECYRQALRGDPSSFEIHKELAILLMNMEEFAEAETHCRWCVQRCPSRKYFQVLLRRSVEGQLRMRTTAERHEEGPFVR